MSEQEKKQVASLLGCDVMKPETHPQSKNVGRSLISAIMLDGMNEVEGKGAGTFKAAGIVEKDMPQALAILVKRIDTFCGSLKITDGARLFAASMCNTPAEAVMWAYTLCCLAEANGGEATALEVVTAFDGPPVELAYRTAWDAQKSPDAPMGNLLDDPATWARFAA